MENKIVYKRKALFDEKKILNDVAFGLYAQKRFDRKFRFPRFEDVQNATGFFDIDDVLEYFNKKHNSDQQDPLIELLSKEEWLYLVVLYTWVYYKENSLLYPREDGVIELKLDRVNFQPEVVSGILSKFHPNEKIVVRQINY